MENTASSFTHGSNVTTPAAGQVCIVANSADIDQLRADKGFAGLGNAALHALAAGDQVPAAALKNAKVLVLEVDPANAASLARISEIRSRLPALTIVAALRDANVSLVQTLIRQGVADVIQLPFGVKELGEQIRESMVRASKSAPQSALAPMLTIVGSVGGCGATTVITHLAAAIARLDGATHKVCVIDLDLQGGEIGYYVGVEPRVTISALLESGDRLDTELLRSAITESNHGFSLIASPTTITPLDDVNEDHLLKLLRLIRQEFDFVLIDLPTDWTSWGLSVAAASSRVLMVMELSVASMRQAKRRLQLFDSVGIALGDVDLLANRIEHKLFHSIGVNEIDNVLGKPALATLSDEDHMMSAQNEGRLIDDIHAHTRFSKDIENLARLLISQKVEMP